MTTTDPLVDAARAEAEALFLNSAEVPSPQDIGEHIAEWARTHLAAQEDDGHDGWCGCGCQAAQGESVLMTSREETISDRLSDAGYTEYAEDEDGGVTWVSAPLGEVLRIVSAAQEPTDAEQAVRELHHEVVVFSLDDMNGTWVYDEDDERVILARLCAECSDDDVINAVEDGEWTENWYRGEVAYPCPTIQALDAARRAQTDTTPPEHREAP